MLRSVFVLSLCALFAAPMSEYVQVPLFYKWAIVTV